MAILLPEKAGNFSRNLSNPLKTHHDPLLKKNSRRLLQVSALLFFAMSVEYELNYIIYAF